MALRARGKRAIQAFVDDRKFFKHETIEGTHMVFGLGKLPEPYRKQLDQFDRDQDIDRVLYSYQTPIAWKTRSGLWIVPPVRYSNTTSNHQHVAKTAIYSPEFYKGAKW